MKTIVTILLLFPICLFGQKNANATLDSGLSFEYFKKNLTEEVKNEIDSIWDLMKNGSEAEFHLLSKQETKKLSNDHQFKLTQMRADSVIAYLHRKRIAPQYTQIKIEPFEKDKRAQCSSTNASYRKMTQQRGKISVIVEKDTYTRKFYHRSEELLLSNTCSEHQIYPDAMQVIYGDQGTMVKFPANCFSTQGLGRVDEIEILLCEYYTMEDLVLSGLTTASSNRIIETGGTVFIEARYKDKKLHLKTDKPIEIFFPSQDSDLKNKMRAFEGKNKDGLVDWKLDNKGEVEKKSSNSLLFTEEVETDIESEDGEFWGEGEGEGYYSESDGYLMKVAKLGFINCDRFYDSPVKTDLLVKADSKVKMSYRLVFEDIKSILPGYEYSPGGTMKFSNLPNGENAMVLAYAISKKDKTALFAYQKVKLGKENKIELQPTTMSIEDLQKELKDLF